MKQFSRILIILVINNFITFWLYFSYISMNDDSTTKISYLTVRYVKFLFYGPDRLCMLWKITACYFFSSHLELVISQDFQE